MIITTGTLKVVSRHGNTAWYHEYEEGTFSFVVDEVYATPIDEAKAYWLFHKKDGMVFGSGDKWYHNESQMTLKPNPNHIDFSPSIPMKEGWKVSIRPHATAEAHLCIEAAGAKVSILFDPLGRLNDNPGVGVWEIYPVNDCDWTVPLDDKEGLIKAVEISIAQQQS